MTAKPYTFKIQYLDNGKLQTLAKRKVDLAQYCSCEQQGHSSVALDLECVPRLPAAACNMLSFVRLLP